MFRSYQEVWIMDCRSSDYNQIEGEQLGLM